MVGIRSFPFGVKGLFQGRNVRFREGNLDEWFLCDHLMVASSIGEYMTVITQLDGDCLTSRDILIGCLTKHYHVTTCNKGEQ